MEKISNSRLSWLICIGLILGCFAIYGPTVRYDFISYDDPLYVTDNIRVRSGVTLSGVEWAFTTSHASNWHPLTWISHMIDCDIYGVKAGGHHFTNILFHTANTLLLFVLWRRMTGALWPSCLVAALFALHPLHIESVAWISERKDVLSTFFWLVTMIAYLRYVAETKAQTVKAKYWYLTALVCFALGLLSKPMVVTLPFALLLLDYWPLGRVSGSGFRVPTIETQNAKLDTRNWWALFLEKIPFMLLAAVSSVMAFIAQKRGGAMAHEQTLTFYQRAANAAVSCIRYVRKTIWPNDLAIFYPHPLSWPAWQAIGALALLAVITALVIICFRRSPYLAVGWFWFLGTLVPVIGLVQVGSQSMADRYTYIPLIGLFIMIIWAIKDLAGHWQRGIALLPALSGAVLLASLVVSCLHVQKWRDTFSLFSDALKLKPGSYTVHESLGQAFMRAGREQEAIPHFEAAMRLKPNVPFPLNSLGLIYSQQGKTELATQFFEAALRLAPAFPQAHYNLALLLAADGRMAEAIPHYEAALRGNPDMPDTHYNFANALAAVGRLPEAVTHYRACLRWEPDSSDAHNNLGAVLVRLGALDEAVAHFEAALRSRPAFAEAHMQLAAALQKLGRVEQAKMHFAEAVRLKPDFGQAHLKFGLLLAQQGQFSEAEAHFTKLTQLEPTNHLAYYNLGAVFAAENRTDYAIAAFTETLRLRPGDMEVCGRLAALLVKSGRTGEAVQLAERAVEVTGRRDLQALIILESVYAEAGRVDDAIKTVEAVIDLARSQAQPAIAEQAAKRLELYKSRKSAR